MLGRREDVPQRIPRAADEDGCNCSPEEGSLARLGRAPERMWSRVLLAEEGQKLKYALDPFTPAMQYMGTRDNRSVRRKTSDTEAGGSMQL